MAAQWADEYNMNFVPPEACREGRERLSAACQAIDRDPESLPLSLMTNTLVGSDRKDLEARAARMLQRRGDAGDPAEFLANLGPERIAGTPDQVLERLAEFAKAGVERVMMQHLLHDDLDMLAILGAEVIPEAANL